MPLNIILFSNLTFSHNWKIRQVLTIVSLLGFFLKLCSLFFATCATKKSYTCTGGCNYRCESAQMTLPVWLTETFFKISLYLVKMSCYLSKLNGFASRSQHRSKLSTKRYSSLTKWRLPRMLQSQWCWCPNLMHPFTLLLWYLFRSCVCCFALHITYILQIFKIKVPKSPRSVLFFFPC